LIANLLGLFLSICGFAFAWVKPLFYIYIRTPRKNKWGVGWSRAVRNSADYTALLPLQ
jgi:hypothetical protein